MAKFELELPTEIVDQISKITDSCEDIFGQMTQAGAQKVKERVLQNLPPGINTPEFKECVKVTSPYLTPSDDGIASKVIITGYFNNRHGQRTPAPLVANTMEYGTVDRFGRGYITKTPFFRKSFVSSEIEKAMLDKQKELTGGLLE